MLIPKEIKGLAFTNLHIMKFSNLLKVVWAFCAQTHSLYNDVLLAKYAKRHDYASIPKDFLFSNLLANIVERFYVLFSPSPDDCSDFVRKTPNHKKHQSKRLCKTIPNQRFGEVTHPNLKNQ
ncbi:hypothetical protein RJT34_25713 [Clitoria ternatea]|uniref:Uncharacterized protein n=1 Tax=Clitoria ternatea TaxID=43366 RepID=A0AAN9FX02_CLITE